MMMEDDGSVGKRLLRAVQQDDTSETERILDECVSVLRGPVDGGDGGGTCVDVNNARGGDGGSVLHEAAARGKCDLCRQLLEFGADAHSRDWSGKLPLHWAAWSGHVNVCRMLLEEGGTNVNVPNNSKYTALHWAAGRGYIELCGLFVDGFDANVHSADDSGQTPLHWAVMYNHVHICTFLVDRGANVNARDLFGRTPLFWAIDEGHANVCAVLLENGADTSVTADGGTTPLMHAVVSNRTVIVDMLLRQKDIDLHATNNSGDSVLDILRTKSDMLDISRSVMRALHRQLVVVAYHVIDSAILEEDKDAAVERQ